MSFAERLKQIRKEKGLSQEDLAELLDVSRQAVSKWERGCGAPDISLLPALAAALGVEPGVFLQGDLDANRRSNGNMKKIRVYVCPACGNVVFSTDEADVICCGKKLAALRPQKADETQRLTMEIVENEWFVTSAHGMLLWYCTRDGLFWQEVQ